MEVVEEEVVDGRPLVDVADEVEAVEAVENEAELGRLDLLFAASNVCESL